MLCYSHDERDLRFNGFFNCLGGLVSGDVDSRCVWLGLLLGLSPVSIDTNSYRQVRTALTDGNTGSPRCSPSTPGFTPPMILVPQARDSLTFAVAWSAVQQ